MIAIIAAYGYLILVEAAYDSEAIFLSGLRTFLIEFMALGTPRVGGKLVNWHKEGVLIQAIEFQGVLALTNAEVILSKFSLEAIGKFFGFLEYSSLRLLLLFFATTTTRGRTTTCTTTT